MINRIKLFPNDNLKSKEICLLLEKKLKENSYIITDKDYDLCIAVGGDGSFLRMLKQNNF